MEIKPTAPAAASIDANGNADRGAIQDEAGKLLFRGRKFANMHQLCQFVSAFGSPWGFDVYLDGTAVKCKCSKKPRKVYSSSVSPSKRRQRECSPKEIDCQFQIKASSTKAGRNTRFGNAPAIYCIPVKVTQASLLHTCQPGKQQQILVRKAAGHYALPEKVKEIAEELELGHTVSTAVCIGYKI